MCDFAQLWSARELALGVDRSSQIAACVDRLLGLADTHIGKLALSSWTPCRTNSMCLAMGSQLMGALAVLARDSICYVAVLLGGHAMCCDQALARPCPGSQMIERFALPILVFRKIGCSAVHAGCRDGLPSTTG